VLILSKALSNQYWPKLTNSTLKTLYRVYIFFIFTQRVTQIGEKVVARSVETRKQMEEARLPNTLSCGYVPYFKHPLSGPFIISMIQKHKTKFMIE
jgi:hypothetical protein